MCDVKWETIFKISCFHANSNICMCLICFYICANVLDKRVPICNIFLAKIRNVIDVKIRLIFFPIPTNLRKASENLHNKRPY